ncbi:uncharacterized protein LOC122249150 isoform X2 [Penaeus japonicus]|uniref:uncharacterized protein LOC122249150 isoform X2 n=1 Tax=Penaeus japonicus TaxID=27405 RepID=UPI001C70D45E|nr:uncharacterized protein LOC122249150 isoform X2 [Penaeus japonicus]
MASVGHGGGQGTPAGYPGAAQEKWDKYYEYISSVEDGNAHHKSRVQENSPINERVETFAESFSAHGFGKIYGSSRFLRRLVWSVVCLVLLAFGSYQCYRVLAEFLTYPKTVTISVEEAVSTEFPAVTVCNLNPLPNKEKLKDHPLWGAFIRIEKDYSHLDCDVDFGSFDYDSGYVRDMYAYDDFYGSDDEFLDEEEEGGSTTDSTGTSTTESFGSQATTADTSQTTTDSSGSQTSQATTTDTSQTTTDSSGSQTSQATTESWGSQATTASDTSDTSPATTESSGSQSTNGMSTNKATEAYEDYEDYEDYASQTTTTGSGNQATTDGTASEATSESATTQATSGHTSAGTTPDSNTASTDDTAFARKRRDARAFPDPTKAPWNAAAARAKPKERGWARETNQQRAESPEEVDQEQQESAWSEQIPRTGVENLLPKPDPEREFFLDFDEFSKRNRHLFVEDSHLPSGRRVKRENVISTAEVVERRLKCSKYYKYLKYMRSEEAADDLKKTEECPEEKYTEDVSYNPLCQVEVFCDKYGCYDFYLRNYKETQYTDNFGKLMRCPECSKPVCWDSDSFSSWGNGTMDYGLVVSIFNSSHTPDLSDVMGLYKPSKDDLKTYSIPPKDFVKTCSYDRRPCSYRLFYSWNSDQYGECHTFNSAFRTIKLKNGRTRKATPWKTSSVGPRNGIRLTLSIKSSNYMTLLSPDMGAKVIVHSPRHIPFPEDEGFNVSPGISVSIAVKTKKIERVGQPWGTCVSNSLGGDYSSLQCKKLCQEKEFWRECGCYVGQSPAYGDQPKDKPATQCSPFNVTQKLCMATVLFSYQQGLLNCKCPPSCNETVYSTQVTSSEENKGFYTIVQNIKKADMGDDLCSGSENGTVRLHLYLESLVHEVIKESPAYTWDTLVCNMGGNLGLFIGMSLVTLVELFEFLLDLGLLCYSARKRTRPEATRVEVKPVTSRGPQPTPAVGAVPAPPARAASASASATAHRPT